MRTLKRIGPVAAAALGVSLGISVLAASCSSDMVVGVSKRDAEKSGGKDDAGRDLCALAGWYGDGTCDRFCVQADPDCEPTQDGGPAPDGGPWGQPCGNVSCPAGTECCNPSCGICVEPGGACDQLACGPVQDGGSAGEPCGDVTCGPGQVCCNPSCGICVEPGGACDQLACGPSLDGGPVPDGGGPVPDGGPVLDGGPAPDGGPGGESCGDVICPAGTECCNPSCGICVEPGGACTQQVCSPDHRAPASGACVRNSDDRCRTDADCVSGGCGGELCYNPAVSDGVTSCDCVAPTPPAVTGCGCVAGRCTWYN